MTAAPAVLTADAPAVAAPTEAGVKAPGRRNWPSWLVRVGAVAAAVVLWQVLTANDIRLWLRFHTLPTVTEIVSAFGHRLGTEDYWLDLGQSLIRILTGFVLAALAGVVTGILLGRSRAFANVFGPLTELARPIPAIAIVPVAILLFPTDEAGSCSSRSSPRTSRSWSALATPCGRCPRCGRTPCGRSGYPWDVITRVVLPGILPGCSGACRSVSASHGSA